MTDTISSRGSGQTAPDAFPYQEIEVFCDCNMAEVYDDMHGSVRGGEDWFRMHCVGLQSPPFTRV